MWFLVRWQAVQGAQVARVARVKQVVRVRLAVRAAPAE
jgi:hypothetical protein